MVHIRHFSIRNDEKVRELRTVLVGPYFFFGIEVKGGKRDDSKQKDDSWKFTSPDIILASGLQAVESQS